MLAFIFHNPMALQFTEHVIKEWTDGVLVIQNYQLYCNGNDVGETSTRFFQYGRSPPLKTKSMRWIKGWDQGPRGQNRYWSAEELDGVMQQWLDNISSSPQENGEDCRIVESVQLLLRGAVQHGDTFEDDSMHYLILTRLSTYITTYMIRNAPLGQQCEALCDQLQATSIYL